MDKEFLKSCVEFLKKEISDKDQEYIANEYKEKGSSWIGEGHFGWGMHIRNQLRSAGFTDDKLPEQNWDDYYIPVVEIAVGVRQVKYE